MKHSANLDMFSLALATNVEEIYAAVPGLFRVHCGIEAGSLFTLQSGMMRRAIGWNDEESPATCEVEDCLGLRTVNLHVSFRRTRCAHVPVSWDTSVCIPIKANAAVLALLVLNTTLAVNNLERIQQFATALGVVLASAARFNSAVQHSKHDPKLGLYNRAFFEGSLDREMTRARIDAKPLSLMFIDLDYFKLYNDHHGHLAGDQLLHEVALVLQRSVRGQDIAARWGGEEFVVILPGAGGEVAFSRAEWLQASMKSVPQVLGGRALTASIGIAIFPEHGRTMAELTAAADAALYRAKEKGRDRIEIATCHEIDHDNDCVIRLRAQVLPRPSEKNNGNSCVKSST